MGSKVYRAIGVTLAATSAVLFVGLFVSAHAARYSSPSYNVDASILGNSFGGAGASTSYKLVSSGGESIIGNGSSGSYKLDEGYVAQLGSASTIQVTVGTATLTINTVIPGTSQSANYNVTTVTNQTGYSLAINQNQDLTSGSNTIPAVSGSIASPAAWSEGTTKGFGFSLVSGAGLPVKWGTGSNYAAIPGTSTTFYTSSGYTPSTNDVVGMRFRLDTANSQPTGSYTNSVTITGTTIP
jgi:hypothetical protein